MQNKSETTTHLVNFINLVENQFGTKVQIIRSDNGNEFKMNSFFDSKGIIHQTTCVETPEQNGIAERKHQHLLNVARALIFQSKISTCFWSYALLHAAFLINVTPTPYLNNQTPHEKLYKNPYNYHDLKVFGCLCYVQTLSAKRSKFEPRARPAIFLGFPPHTKGYIAYDLKSHDIKTSRNVLFHEDIFPSCYNIDNNVAKDDVCLPISQSYNPVFDYELHNDDNSGNTTNIDNLISADQNCTSSTTDTRKSNRIRSLPAYLKDYQIDLACVKNTKYPIQSYISLSRLSTHFQQVILNIDSNREPKSFEEVAQNPDWKKAMDTELSALEQNQTWTITNLPSGCKTIGCKWVFKIKHRADGSVERHKARLVAKGFTQLEGMDFHDTFAPVAKLTTVRFIIDLAAIKNWKLTQLDVNNAFLHGELDETIYMDLPPGLMHQNSKQVCLLHKSLYVLRQASR